MANQSRGIWTTVLRNFINSFRPKQIRGNKVGEDYFGNIYYEIPADPTRGKRKASRWFDPPKGDFMQEMPAEWESWLRGRRTNVPSEEEIMRNLAIMQIKKKNAVEVDAKGGRKTPLPKGYETFPKPSEYEGISGKKLED